MNTVSSLHIRSLLQDDIARRHIKQMLEMKHSDPSHGLWLDPLILRLEREIEDRLEDRKLLAKESVPLWMSAILFTSCAACSAALIYFMFF